MSCVHRRSHDPSSIFVQQRGQPLDLSLSPSDGPDFPQKKPLLPLGTCMVCLCNGRATKGQWKSPHGADPELEPMMLDDDAERKSHTMDDANGHSSIDANRGCHSMDIMGSSVGGDGISSDKAVFHMIDIQDCNACVVNAITTTIKESDELCEGFRKTDKARQYVDELIKNSKFPPAEISNDYIDKYMLSSISGKRNKALFLGYMVKCLLLAFTGKRKCDNKDDFWNKRKRFGEVKLGEIEHDCLLAHGAAAYLHERLFMLSDFSQMHVCQICDRVANVS
ncbi:hypothetical protein ABZP36_007280 [Zizania latifolia]